ncbi:MAG: O-antigen ligase family protein, partial [Tumebacillaceae bacterium]
AYFALYLLARILLSSVNGLRMIMVILAISGTVYSFYGLLGLWGVVKRPGVVMQLNDGVRRIASAFEYANTFASYVALALVLGLVLQALSKRRNVQILWMIANAVSLSGVTLTYSRGAWLTLLGTIVLLILFAPRGNRVGISLNSFGVLVSALAGMPLFASAAQDGSAGKGIIGLLILSVIGVALTFLIERLTRKVEGLIVSTKVVVSTAVILLALPVATYALGIIPNSIAERLSSISLNTFSVQQRLVFYQDGIKALQDHPLIGAGDRTWEAVFYKYQSYPYYTTSSHSMLVDQLMNVGLVGTLLLLTVIVMTVVYLWKLRKQGDGVMGVLASALLAGFLELVLHGMIDVDFNYAIIGYLFWLLVALSAMARPLETQSVTAMNAWKWAPRNRWFWWTLLPFSLLIMLYSGSYVYATHQVDLATTQFGDPPVALQYVDAAKRVAPYLADVKTLEANLDQMYYQRNQDSMIQVYVQQSYEELANISPDNALLLVKAGQGLAENGKPLQGSDLIKRAWQDAPYRAEIAEQYMTFSAQIGEALLQQGQKERAKGYFQETLATYQQVESRVQGLQELPSLLKPERPYAITSPMYQYAAESALFTGQYPLAEQWAGEALMDAKLTQDSKATVTAIRALALEKQGKVDAKLLQDPKVKSQYDRLKSLF